MVPPRRKVTENVEYWPPSTFRRKDTTSKQTHQQSAVRKRKTEKPTTKKAVKQTVKKAATTTAPRKRKIPAKAIDQIPTFKTPNNPQATFEGLPPELRLHIYDLLCDSTIIHVHRHRQDGRPIFDDDSDDDSPNSKVKFSWTPCRSPNPTNPLLCANPKWSGTCKEEDRCTYKIHAPREPVGFWALAACNKAIRRETKEPFLRNTVVSIHPSVVVPWLNHLAKHAPNQINHIRRVTLAGPDSAGSLGYFAPKFMRDRLPNLQAVGFQCQSPAWHWGRRLHTAEWHVPDDAWKNWRGLNWGCVFDPSVTIAYEAMVWKNRDNIVSWNPDVLEKMVAIRVLRRGNESPEASEGTVPIEWEAEIKEYPIVETKRNAKWRAWWRTEEVKGFA
jgi:hypothetical protein